MKMEVQSLSFSYCLLQLLLLLLLVFINGAVAGGPSDPISTQAPYDRRHYHAMEGVHHSPSTSSSLKNMIFFHCDDLKAGKTIPLYFPPKNPSKTPRFLPRQDADSLPFSLRDLPFLLRFFNFTPGSPQSKAIEETLAHCESPPIRGEFKFCATSLESMLDRIRSRFGSGFRPKLLTTTWIEGLDSDPGLRRYSVVGDPIEKKAPNIVACHLVPYPFAVFYCHGQSEGQNKLFRIEMDSEGGAQEEGKRVRVRVMAMCHMDTSDWNTGHVAFVLLGVEPGKAPVCHIFPPDNLVWVPIPSSPSSSSSLST